MTYLLAGWLGVAVGCGVTYAAHLRWAEDHHYRRVRLEVTRVRDLAVMADHDHRTMLRWKGAVAALRALHDDIVGDLLDKVAEQARQLDQLHRARHRRVPRYSPAVWTYGRGRTVTS